MRYYVHHWRGRAREVPGVIQEGKPLSVDGPIPYWMDLDDKQFGPKILELMKDYDVMLLGPNESFSYPRLCIDFKGYKFRQM